MVITDDEIQAVLMQASGRYHAKADPLIGRIIDVITWLKAECDNQATRILDLEEALGLMLIDPVATLDDPDTDAQVITKMREIALAALKSKD